MTDFPGMRLDSLPPPGGAAGAVDALLGVDTEDWYQIMLRNVGRGPRLCHAEFRRGLDALLALLADRRCRATFFILGMTAAEDRSLVPDLLAAGHEVATHGFGHVHLERISLDDFRQDLRRAMGELSAMTGQPVLGHRAPEFSVPRGDPAGFFRVLVGAGLRYDSSVFPIRGRRYGLAGFPRTPTRVSLPEGSLVELPLATARWAGRTWPLAGGGYWRLLPAWLLLRLLARARRQGVLPTLYLHPYEFDPQRLDQTRIVPVAELPAGWKAVRRQQNLFRRSMPGKLSALLCRYRVTCCCDYLARVAP